LPGRTFLPCITTDFNCEPANGVAGNVNYIKYTLCLLQRSPQLRCVERAYSVSLALIVTGLFASFAEAQLPVPSAGVIQDVDGATDKPDPSRIYKLAFDVQSMADSADKVSPALMGIAKLLNTYRKYGVPVNHIMATAVFHGPTIVVVTKDDTYRGRTGAKANPNVDLLRQLAAAGVKFVVCGVSARAQNYQASDLVPLAKLNLSATVTFIDLQLKGYVKVER
jgi:intracellular sulfur oxidation DsrE/DsrF family protein